MSEIVLVGGGPGGDVCGWPETAAGSALAGMSDHLSRWLLGCDRDGARAGGCGFVWRWARCGCPGGNFCLTRESWVVGAEWSLSSVPSASPSLVND